MGRFEIRDEFYLDGQPFKIISGSIHYFRVPPAYWRDRLEKLKALGCNAVETYVAWNMHEPKKGSYVFEGMMDIVGFLRIAQELGLYTIVRPSPYICAEWEFGGLPAWLLNEPDIKLRSSEGPFLTHVARYYEKLLPMLAPLQIDRGGSIILMQVENEYGAFGDDPVYMAKLRDMMRAGGVTVPMITSDGPWNDYLDCGSVDGALPTANFGSKAKEQLGVLRKHVKKGPLMCTEFWVGWFDHWGCGQHHTTDPQAAAKELDAILAQGSVNIYMFHGGTNFGFTNGSNDYGKLTPDVTSYDYDALLTEDGRMTPKYEAFRAVIAKYAPVPKVEFSTQIPRIAPGELSVQGRAPLFEALPMMGQPVNSLHPQPMEALGQNFGYVLYRTVLPLDKQIEKFRLWQTGDRAQVFADGQPSLTLYDRELLKEHDVDWQYPAGTRLDILVENMGRVNYGVRMREQHKGIAGDVLLNGHFHTGWEQFALSLEMAQMSRLAFSERDIGCLPAFHRFSFDVQELGDTFLDMEGWGKGCAFLNGFNLGRFWEIGPQKRLYIPAPLLRLGVNELVIFETEGHFQDTVRLRDTPMLG